MTALRIGSPVSFSPLRGVHGCGMVLLKKGAIDVCHMPGHSAHKTPQDGVTMAGQGHGRVRGSIPIRARRRTEWRMGRSEWTS